MKKAAYNDSIKWAAPSSSPTSHLASPISQLFKTAGGWIFKHFFDDSEIFRELVDHYNKDLFRFEFKTVGERNKSLKLLELRGFEVEHCHAAPCEVHRAAHFVPVLLALPDQLGLPP